MDRSGRITHQPTARMYAGGGARSGSGPGLSRAARVNVASGCSAGHSCGDCSAMDVLPWVSLRVRPVDRQAGGGGDAHSGGQGSRGGNRAGEDASWSHGPVTVADTFTISTT
jgi:hypothetical protein